MTKLKSLILLAALGTLIGCSASGPATKFYSLFADRNTDAIQHNLESVPIGIGPIILPEYLENPAIVSLTQTQQIRVSGYHAWAGDLKEGISRVLADNVSMSLQFDEVWSFPWDNRARPEYQVRLVFEEFAGVRGGKVLLKVKWSLLGAAGSQLLEVGTESFEGTVSSDSADAYVETLNQLLNQFSSRLSSHLINALSAN